MRVKGTFHAHSTLSHDGKLPIPELARFFRERGYHFLCLTEHAEDMHSGTVEQMRQECAAVSSEDFLLLPGNEFICTGDVHLLGLGAVDLIGSTDPMAVARGIREQGGLAVLAHPRRIGWQCPLEVLRTIDAIEIWNVGYDGKYLPAAQALESFRRMRAVNQGLLALPGHDFHRRESFYPVGVEMDVERLDRSTVLAALREGGYRIRSPFFSADAAARVSVGYERFVVMLSRQLDRARRLRARWHDGRR